MTTIFYHAHCADGFAAAFAAWLVYGDRPGVQYVPVSYGQPVPELPDGHGKHTVYILDFSWPRHWLEALAARPDVESVTVIDHHQTAAADLEGIPYVDNARFTGGLRAFFDMARSGAVLAWLHFHDDTVPELLRYVQDRDLWQWRLTHSRAISAALKLRKYRNFDSWRELLIGWDDHIKPRLVIEGSALVDAEETMLDGLANQVESRADMWGNPFVRCNSPVLQSELGERLLRDNPQAFYADVWSEFRGERRHSLRSRQGDKVDVSGIAKYHGGGGHRCASGYTEVLP